MDILSHSDMLAESHCNFFIGILFSGEFIVMAQHLFPLRTDGDSLGIPIPVPVTIFLWKKEISFIHALWQRIFEAFLCSSVSASLSPTPTHLLYCQLLSQPGPGLSKPQQPLSFKLLFSSTWCSHSLMYSLSLFLPFNSKGSLPRQSLYMPPVFSHVPYNLKKGII